MDSPGEGMVFCIAECFTCGQLISFNPNLVPSVRDAQQVRQPVCFTCVRRANPHRVENGLPPIEILPGAYEGMKESEL